MKKRSYDYRKLLRELGWISFPTRQWGGHRMLIWQNPRGGQYTFDQAIDRIGIDGFFAQYATNAPASLDVPSATSTPQPGGERIVRIPVEDVVEQTRRWQQAGAAFNGIKGRGRITKG